MKSLAHWRPYLGWTKEPFVIITDHANLQYWKSPQNLNRQTARWHADLQEYDYQIKYIPGNTNIPADALSRPSNADQGKDDNKDVALIPPERFANTARVDPEYDERTKRNLMVLYHDHPTAGHPRRDETIRKVQQSHNWIGMRQWIADYIKGCAVCQQNKIQTHKRKTPLYKITTTKGTLPFRQIAMDLITELPMHKGYNAILTIVDHGCSHAAIFLPCSTSITGPGIARLYLDNVYRWFGLPTKIISDRDPRFTSHFGKALTERLGIQQNLSSAFHPQTDGLSERKNQWIEQYLRLITMAQPEDWTEWLSIASAVHNNRQNTTTGLSPNQILLGYKIELFPSEQSASNNQTVEDRMKQMMEKRAQATDALNKSAQAFQPPSQYHQGDKVWLEASNL
jgi:transposase InsO family protein